MYRDANNFHNLISKKFEGPAIFSVRTPDILWLVGVEEAATPSSPISAAATLPLNVVRRVKIRERLEHPIGNLGNRDRCMPSDSPIAIVLTPCQNNYIHSDTVSVTIGARRRAPEGDG